MAVTKGFPSRDAAADAPDVRKALAGVVATNSDGSVRAGLLGFAANVVASKASMAVDVAPFQAVSANDSGRGALFFSNDGMVAVSLAAAPAANSRIDVIYAKAADPQQSDANALTVIDKVTGVADASPVKPSIPARAVELGTVTVPAGAVTTQSSGVVIAQTSSFSAAAGGVVPLRNAAQQTAFVAADGQQVYRADSGASLVRRGGAWVPMRGVRHQRSGAAVAGIDVPASVSNDGPLIVQTGIARFFPTLAFGNGYGPTITFPQAFPNAVLSFVAQPILVSGLTTRDHAIDVLTTTQARVFYPGTDSDQVQRAFTWIAVGY